MLELPRLLLRPQSLDRVGRGTLPISAHAASVAILDPIAGQVLGEVLPARKRPWLRWFLPPTWTVCENEDRSLVFTLSRTWLGAEWTIIDSEPRHVGTVLNMPGRSPSLALYIADRRGSLLAREDTGCLARFEESTAKFVSPTGIELAALEFRDGERELSFAETTESNPFGRMLLLAAALVCSPLSVRERSRG
jgi:hypothetical protein